MKKFFTLLTLLLCAVTSSWGAAVSDLKTIATDYVFIADNFTANGTVKLTANTLYDGNVIFAPTANSVANNKGSVNFEGGNHLNSLRLKNAQDRLAFKVNGACTVTFYTYSDSQRGIYVSKSDNVTTDAAAYAKQPASTSVWEVSLDEAGVYYLTSYNSDFYFAGFKVTFPKTGQPTINTNPVAAEYSQGDAATALTVSATAANSGALSYQWYKNETNQSVLAGEGATAIDGANSATYAPSTTTAGTTYYFCKVTEEGNANVATSRMAKVLVNPAGFNVTYSLGSVTGTEGLLPADESYVNSVTIPVNKTLYKDGYTLTAWNDGSADHAIGSSFDVTSDVTLTPVFTANGASTYLGHNAATAIWNFNSNTGAPLWNMNGSGTFVYVTQVSLGGNNMDLKMNMDATGSGAKIASNGDWTQINTNSKLTVPVIVGAVVKVYVYSDAAAPTFDGNDGDYDSTNKIYSYTATADGNLDIVYGGNDYASKVEVVYPSESAVLTVSANNTEIALTRASINGADYLSAVTDGWQTSKTYGAYTGDFVNMSKAERYITVDVTGAKYFEVFVQNGTAGRTYTVKVGDAAAQEVIHAGGNIKSSGVFAIADPTATTTIKIAGGGSNANSVYPVAIKFNPATTITPAKEYTTYVTPTALDFTGIEGLKAYIATEVTAGSVQMTRVNKVPAGTGLVLVKTSGSSFDVPVFDGTGADNVSGNKMAGSATETTAVAANAGYILKDGVFQPSSVGDLPAGKAYLSIAVSGARELMMSFEDDDVTGIQSIENGKSTIDNAVYDLSGRRVAQPTKGLYIVNGKKVVIK